MMQGLSKCVKGERTLPFRGSRSRLLLLVVLNLWLPIGTPTIVIWAILLRVARRLTCTIGVILLFRVVFVLVTGT